MGTDIDAVLADADALMQHIKDYMDVRNRKSAHVQRLVQLADELIEELNIEKEEEAST